MLDHVGFGVSDYDRSKDFYERALAPLGISLLMELVAPRDRRRVPCRGGGGGRHRQRRARRPRDLPPALLRRLRARSRREQHRGGLSPRVGSGCLGGASVSRA